MSGYGETRSFETHPGEGGEESEALGLSFKSTPCEDWYGFGDGKCPNRYKETGDLETDIKSLEKWSGLYRKGKWWQVINSDELYRKQAEFNIIRDAQEKKDLLRNKLVNLCLMQSILLWSKRSEKQQSQKKLSLFLLQKQLRKLSNILHC